VRETSFVTNTESDVLIEIASQEYFVLLSGPWFKEQVPRRTVERGRVKSSARAGIQKVLEHTERSMELGPR